MTGFAYHSLTESAVSYTRALLAIDSPSGFTQNATDYLLAQLRGMGFEPQRTRKGAVTCAIGGQGTPTVLAAHVDTLGLMVRKIDSNGHLRFTRIGGPMLSAVETENVVLYTRDGRTYTGVVLLENTSVHVNPAGNDQIRTIDNMEILLDEWVSSSQDVAALGIAVGDIVALDPRTRYTPGGFLRSRFLDDKLSAGMLLALAQSVQAGKTALTRKVTLLFSVYEEVGHGASHGLPQDTQDLLVVDMGCVGDGLSCTEAQVSICVKDGAGPYDYQLTSELIHLAQARGVSYATDVYLAYSSDSATALRAGKDIRFALIGSGVYASHGYERTHAQGISHTLALIEAFVSGGGVVV